MMPPELAAAVKEEQSRRIAAFDKRAPGADLTNGERPRGDRPPPAVAPKLPDLVPPEHAGHGSVGMRIRTLESTIASYRRLAEGLAGDKGKLLEANTELMRELMRRDEKIATLEEALRRALNGNDQRAGNFAALLKADAPQDTIVPEGFLNRRRPKPS